MKPSITTAGLLLMLLLAFVGMPVHAAPEPQVVLQAWQVQRVVEQGVARERLQPLQKIRPGDVIEYEARYVNSVIKPVHDVQVTLPVPDGGLQYLPGGEGATPVYSASLDGVKFERVPLRREVRLPDGRRGMEEVPLSEYRYLRWNLGDLPAGGQRAVRARMQLPVLHGARS